MKIKQIIQIIIKDIIPSMFIAAIIMIGILYIIVNDISVRCQLIILFVIVSITATLFFSVLFAVDDLLDEFLNK